MGRRKFELDGAPGGEPVRVYFEERELEARLGEPLEVALLANGIHIASRSVKYHRPRGAFCMSGVCGQCWMRIDDVPNRAACTTPVHDGMIVQRQNAFPSAEYDVLGATDVFFSRGLDHHTLGTTPIHTVNRLIGETARALAGTGTLSEKPAPPPAPMRVEVTDVAVIGAGPAGLSAAIAAAEGGAKVVLIEARSEPGGHLLAGLYDDVPELLDLRTRGRSELERLGGAFWGTSLAAGIYRGQGSDRHILVRRKVVNGAGPPDEHLVLLQPRALVLANGGYEQAPLCESNDVPGLYGARALAELALRRGVLPGKRVVILDGGGASHETALRFEGRLKEKNVDVTRTADRPVRFLGKKRVKGVELEAREGGGIVQLACDVVAAALPLAPAFELASQADCRIEHRPSLGGFVVGVDEQTQQTSVAGVYAAGDNTGSSGASAAAAAGRIAGRKAAEAAKAQRTERAAERSQS